MEPNPNAGLVCEGLTKRFGGTPAVDGVSIAIAPGEFFAVLGPSGCGKSTLLRLVAGLEAVDEGTIALRGDTVAGNGRHVPPEDRGVAVVFQSYALWPHMSVRQNVAFPTESLGLDRAEAAAVVDRALGAVALEAYEARRPAALSGGQQQRVALARCLASHASVVLMDEPLANLDPHLRAAMEDELRAVHEKAGATTLYITHDQREAMALADRIAVMQAGRFLQVAPPGVLYDEPASADVARFIGRSTLADVTITQTDIGRAVVTLAGITLEARAPATQRPGAATLVIRPHEVRLGEGPFTGTLTRATYRGGVWDLAIRAPGLPLIAAESRTRPTASEIPFTIEGGWILPS